ncbi:glucose-6-phosphate isomerase [Sansalvadorimonas sp. 2012CJ34-2]|uniref:Glucose-6-phosphate isomerase n=1 Tax=Parendozoicomonas callyspongiae TaxID=2942213 RepID=A0ABT0PLC0_9GAMM|nr:glucose-6-phosphate isomerase [Sansalvadorimonas sp. 2012CJ34-2]MCL6271781.1 glucose-6-phosphate isomerase [Sansalvadorimonas sp. 2012CJ34-2]
MSSTLSPLPGFSVSGKLGEQASQIPGDFLRTTMQQDSDRFNRYSIEECGLLLDYTRHLIDDSILSDLFTVARESKLEEAIKAQFSGEIINNTEKRAVLHSALRAQDNTPVLVDGEDIKPGIKAMREQMKAICERVHSGEWKGHTGKTIRHVVNIGIGGSYLGLKVVTDALHSFWQGQITPHYVANIDPADITSVLKNLNPEETLFVIASKTFTTLETLANAQQARKWLLESGISEADLAKHLIAVSCNIQAATEFGVAEENILPLWDWVGGRYSLWSAIGLIISLTIGYDRFEELLAGAGDMDKHFQEAPLEKNMPVLMSMLGVWYHHFFDAQSHAVISYDHGLRGLVDHLQQVDMESNGKRVTKDGKTVSCNTGPIIWGGSGTNDQHAYMQLLHQGTRTIPVDFIMPATSHSPVADQHEWLFANGLAQANALANGRSIDEVREELATAGKTVEEIERLAPHKVIPGNRPCSLLLCKALTPYTLGAILAMYEQKIFVQSVIWQINAFDQWGVELGKLLGKQLYPMLKGGDLELLDSSTRSVIEQFRKAQ